MGSKPLKTLLTYDGLIKYLEECGYKKIAEGEFIAYTIKEIGVEDVLVIRRGGKYKESIEKIKKELAPGRVEGSVKTYGILFVNKYVVFLRLNFFEHKVEVLRKSLDKISPAFQKKMKKFLNKIKELGKLDPDDEDRRREWNNIWNELFDRSDIIEEFYKLYIRARENLVNAIKGIHDDIEKEEFADNLLMQLLIIWYLQEKRFFNGDPRYLITKFKEYKKLGFESYYDFLKKLFEKMMSEPNDEIYYKDETFGRIVVTGSAPFLNGRFQKVQIPDGVFYIEGKTEDLKKTEPNKLSPSDVPILNLFESRDWTEGNIDAFVLGAIFEKMMTSKERKEKGAYYTPEKITEYICNNTIKPYLIDRINEKFGTNYTSLDEFFDNDSSEEHYKYLFEVLKEIKILDPACGSGHFLESAINSLVDIYEKLREKAKSCKFDPDSFSIITVDEHGKILKESLLGIEAEDERLLKLKFHIIISRNIYGVDIIPSAIKIARARLFLTLAKHFDPNKRVHIRFPNVHFNLRVGNSLIGVASLNSEIFSNLFGQVTLDQFFSFSEGNFSSLDLKLDPELYGYLKKMDSILNTKSISFISELKKHAREKLTKKALQTALNLRSELIKILLVSLNTKYAIKLKKLIDALTKAFNEKINKEFVSYLKRGGIKVTEEILEKRVGYFHWVMEFSEVLLESGGFDIILGNPPYVRQERINDLVKEIDYKNVLTRLYSPSENTFDLSMYFILRSLELLKEEGYHSFIITNKWLRAKYGIKIRKFLRDHFVIKKIIDFTGVRVFIGPTVDTMIYIIKKERPNENNKIFYNNPKSLEDMEDGGYHVKQLNLEDDAWNFVDERALEIKRWIEKVGVPLKTLNVKIYRGITTGFNDAFIIDDETRRRLIEEDSKSEELLKPILRGRDIERYYAEWNREWIITTFPSKKVNIDNYIAIKNHLLKFREYLEPKPKEWEGEWKGRKPGDYKWYEIQDTTAYYQEFEKPKIVFSRIIKKPQFFYDISKFYVEATSYILTSNSLSLKQLLLLLNCDAVYNMFYIFYSGGGIDGEIKIVKLKLLPIRIPANTKPYEVLADYLLFLNTKEEFRDNYKELINFFDKQIVDSLIYELYFKERFHEDELYQEPKEYLLELVSKYLKPINYEKYAKLYWKEQLEGSLMQKEREELKQLEEENLKVIKAVYKSLKDNPEVNKLIEKIKSHEWVKIIEKR